MKETRRLSDKAKKYIAVIELGIGILIFAAIAQVVTLIITLVRHSRILYYSLGIWLGAVLAIGCAIHMYRTFDKAFDYDEKNAVKISRNGALFRYAILCIIFGLIMYFDFINPLTTFAGLMGLKMGAYMNPLIHKSMIKLGYIDPDPEPMTQEEYDALCQMEDENQTSEDENVIN